MMYPDSGFFEGDEATVASWYSSIRMCIPFIILPFFFSRTHKLTTTELTITLGYFITMLCCIPMALINLDESKHTLPPVPSASSIKG